jgi:hypothetical protein
MPDAERESAADDPAPETVAEAPLDFGPLPDGPMVNTIKTSVPDADESPLL